MLKLIDAAAAVVPAGPSPHLRVARELVHQQRAVVFAIELHSLLPAARPDDAIQASSVLRLDLHGCLAEPHGRGAKTTVCHLQQSNAVGAEVPWPSSAVEIAALSTVMDSSVTMRPTATVAAIDEAVDALAVACGFNDNIRRLQTVVSFALLKWIGTSGAALHRPCEAAIVRGIAAARSADRRQQTCVPCIAVAGALGESWVAFPPLTMTKLTFAAVQATAWSFTPSPSSTPPPPPPSLLLARSAPVTADVALPSWLGVSCVPLVTPPSLADAVRTLQSLTTKCGGGIDGSRSVSFSSSQTTTTSLFVLRVGQSIDALPLLPHQLSDFVDALHANGHAVAVDLTHPLLGRLGSPSHAADWAATAVGSGADMVWLPHPKTSPALWNATQRAVDALVAITTVATYSSLLRHLSSTL